MTGGTPMTQSARAEGLTLNEVAQELGRTAAAVAGLLQRGLRALRRRLKEAE